MPAMLDDPDAATIYRTAGAGPYPDPLNPNPPLPIGIHPRQVTLRDRITLATIIPYSSSKDVPPSLLAYLSDQLNKEIELGDTYPMINTMSTEKFASYWFQNFGAIMFLGNIERAEDVVEGMDFTKQCLGSYYIKPNYPGRSSHICNAGFLVTDAARARGVGRLLGESYIDWAPRLGYTYSIFNLVYETNVASCKIWDALGFKRVGRVKGAGNLRSYPNQPIDAIIFGRDLGPDSEDLVSEERFDKIKFYLKFGKYPNGSDRAEKSRLRSAATHYKLVDGEKLMLKGKEVVSDPSVQYEIANNVHMEEHAGINKCTQSVSAKYHWVRIKETVSLVIKNCTTCKEASKEKAPPAVKDNINPSRRRLENTHTQPLLESAKVASSFGKRPVHNHIRENHITHMQYRDLGQHIPNQIPPHQEQHHHQQLTTQPQIQHLHHLQDYNTIPLDPQIMEDIQPHLHPHLNAYNPSPQPPPNLQSPPQIQHQQNISITNPLYHHFSHTNSIDNDDNHNRDRIGDEDELENDNGTETEIENQVDEDLEMLLEEESLPLPQPQHGQMGQSHILNQDDEQGHSGIGEEDMLRVVEEAMRGSASDGGSGGQGSNSNDSRHDMMSLFEHEFRRR